ncbi:kelch repeat and BTB domain-containing protein 3-like [Microplitis mediator]|uniref:kelch repeat and BTB domain-containing protein 3-like n=1 Tax=Microplitis mediator TaxID=375433 RepID=UPI0025540662|nr:kelch repeat and BTB domain-containing protein 3-like [Microplitis mediator]
MDSKNENSFIVEHRWSSGFPLDNNWSQPECFTFPNYDKIFFSMHVKNTKPTFEVKIVKKGIFNPSRAKITIYYLGSSYSVTMIDWSGNESDTILVKEQPYSIDRGFKCRIELDEIDFDKADLKILSSISGINDLNKYFLSSKWSDVTIKDKNNTEELPAHKVLLASNSCVFERMFETNMKEARENCIRFDEFEADTITEMLRFLYTGRVEPENDYNVLLKLLEFSHMYQITKLTIYMSYKLIQNLTADNVIDILVKTDKFNVPKLHEKALLYLDCIKERISFSKAFEEFNNSKVLRKFFKNKVQMKNDEFDMGDDQ